MSHNTAEVLNQMDGLTFIREIYPECSDPDQQSEVRVKCLFHDDGASPSGSFNIDRKMFRCFSCGMAGDAFTVLAKFMNSSRAVAVHYIAAQLGVPSLNAVPPKVVEEFHAALRINVRLLEELLNRRGLDAASVDRWRLGWDGKKQRLTIPIREEGGATVNLRQYDLLKVHDEKEKFINLKGKGELRLYPYEAFQQTHVVLAEGELKMMALQQRGFNAVTCTGGAAGWKDSWDRLFKDKVVYICYDIDVTGVARAQTLARRLINHAASVHIIRLPLDPTAHPKGDVCDYFVKEKYTPQDFYNLQIGTPAWSPTATSSGLDDEHVYEVELGQASKAQYYLHHVQTEVIISAKDTMPYIAPKETRINCLRDQEICAGCPVFANSEETIYEVAADDPDLLRLIDVSVRNQEKEIKELIGIPAGCKSSDVVVVSSHNLEEVRLVPQLNASQHAPTGGEQTVVKAYNVGHGIETNATYAIRARVAALPKTQHATLLVYSAEANVDSLSSFQPTPEEMKELEIFRPTAWDFDAIEAKLNEIAIDYESNVHRIYQRREMQLVMDLVWHSALYVTLETEPQKGWVEALVIGDSGQGKSEMMKRLMTHYNLGEKIDMKGASVAGLKGGLQETNGRWFVTWGTITLNDRRMVALDECEGAAEAVLQSLTDMRSSGMAELTKIERRKAYARTRQLWTSNARGNRSIETYSFGVEAVRELLGTPQDVRRFDLAIAVASNEVPQEVINRGVLADRAEHVFTSERSRRLILWSWSRAAGQVIIEHDAKQACLEHSLAMGKKYSSSIPLVEPADHRLKLARLATSLAARTFSASEDQQSIVVRKCHVDYVAAFLDHIYTAKFMGYDTYSEVRNMDASLIHAEMIKDQLQALQFPAETIRGLLRTPATRPEDLGNWAGTSIEQAKDVMAILVRNNAMRRGRDGYIKTGPFIEFLKSLKLNGHSIPSHVASEMTKKVEKGF